MKNNNSLSKFKQVLELSGFEDVTKKIDEGQLVMARGYLIFLVTDKGGGKYRVAYKKITSEGDVFGHMGTGNESKAMDYIREILMEVA